MKHPIIGLPLFALTLFAVTVHGFVEPQGLGLLHDATNCDRIKKFPTLNPVRDGVERVLLASDDLRVETSAITENVVCTVGVGGSGTFLFFSPLFLHSY
jgi:hypothetical protein